MYGQTHDTIANDLLLF